MTELVDIEVDALPGGDGVLIRIDGEIDIANSASVEQRLSEQLEANAPTVVDMRGVEYLGSAGLRTLTTWGGRAAERGVKVAVVAVGHLVLRPLAIVGIGEWLAVFEDVPEAAEFVRS